MYVGTTDLVAGEVTAALIGLSNEGDKDFIITSIEGSLRFPQDFSYYIQNVRFHVVCLVCVCVRARAHACVCVYVCSISDGRGTPLGLH